VEGTGCLARELSRCRWSAPSLSGRGAEEEARPAIHLLTGEGGRSGPDTVPGILLSGRPLFHSPSGGRRWLTCCTSLRPGYGPARTHSSDRFLRSSRGNTSPAARCHRSRGYRSRGCSPRRVAGRAGGSTHTHHCCRYWRWPPETAMLRRGPSVCRSGLAALRTVPAPARLPVAGRSSPPRGRCTTFCERSSSRSPPFYFFRCAFCVRKHYHIKHALSS